ncbi:MAG: glycosyltransferase family 2 protein [Bacteroidales bacterium]|nr:glycosyltransferase family 2 protein [Bacteroidales bacterium]
MKLSIITVNLNNKIGLSNTINSVKCQDYKDFEYLIIDGNSKDGSVDIIKDQSNNITKWISEPDNGIYDAMNKGIIMAKGEYMLFLNSGDTLYNNKTLSTIFSTDTTENFIYGKISCTNKIIEKNLNINSRNKVLSIWDFYKSSLPHQATFIKRVLFDKYGLYDTKYKIASDWKFFIICIILNSESYIYKDLIISKFDATGISNNSSSAYIERKDIFNKMFPNYIYPLLNMIDRNYKLILIIEKIRRLLKNK